MCGVLLLRECKCVSCCLGCDADNERDGFEAMSFIKVLWIERSISHFSLPYYFSHSFFLHQQSPMSDECSVMRYWWITGEIFITFDH